MPASLITLTCRGIIVTTVCVMLSACSSTQPVAYSGIASASMLSPNLQDQSGRVPYSYEPEVNWRHYNSVLLEPVVIYRGADEQFKDLSEKDKLELMSYMTTQFTEKLLQARVTLVKTPTPATLRVRLTLTGARTNTPVLGTLSRFDLAGGIYNSVQNFRDQEGTLTGSVSYSVEIFDVATGRLLNAYVAKQYPSPWNISASMGALSASKAGIDKAAMELASKLK
jgi:hypothetical protein